MFFWAVFLEAYVNIDGAASRLRGSCGLCTFGGRGPLGAALYQRLQYYNTPDRHTGGPTGRDSLTKKYKKKARGLPCPHTYIYMIRKKGSVDLGYHTRCHTRYTLGTHRVPTHTNTRKHHHTQTAPRRTRARYDANLGNGVGDPSTEEGRLVLGTRERQLTGNLPRRRHVQRHRHALRHQ